MTREDLYTMGTAASQEFLAVNGMVAPTFMSFEEAAVNCRLKNCSRQVEYWRRANGLNRWANTGLYYDGYVWVNVGRTALPVVRPRMCSWSWPGWKTDRTAMGVVAHETGHYVDDYFLRPSVRAKAWSDCSAHPEWRMAAGGRPYRPVSGYEPNAAEAWAETLRLFILNPDLLQRALPARWRYVTGLGLRPVSRLLRKGWRAVLANAAYETAAERWMGVN